MTPSVHADESVKLNLERRRHHGAPEGECGNCRERWGSAKNCLNPKACIHGWSLARVQAWRAENPNFGEVRRGS